MITDLPVRNDIDGAVGKMIAHIGDVEAGLTKRLDRVPLLDLRAALQHPFMEDGR